MIDINEFPERALELLLICLFRKLRKKEKAELDQWRSVSKRNEELFHAFPDPDKFWEEMRTYESLKRTWRKLVEKAPQLKGLNPKYEQD
jgi:hypothetical protein